MNLIDLGVILILVLYVVRGIRRGLLLGAVDIFGFGFTLLVSLMTYRGVATAIGHVWHARVEVAQLVSFFSLAVLSAGLFSLTINYVIARLRPRGRPGSAAKLNAMLGCVPGVVQGGLVSTLMVLAVSLLPLSGSFSARADDSLFAPYFRRMATQLAPGIQRLVSALPSGNVNGVATAGEAGKLKLRFPKDLQLSVQQAAEARMLELVNRDRASAGLAPLVMDGRLRSVARAHSKEMFRLSYFAHESPRTGTPADRLRRAKIPFLTAGENLAYQPGVEIAHRELMKSPGHRKNLLSPLYSRVGIGIIRGGPYGEMYTQEFTD